MGQPVSKNAQGNMAYPPFENYQGPPMAPGGLTTAQYPPPGGRVVSIDDREPFWDQDPVYVPDAQPPPRTARGNFGPPGMPRRRPPFGPPDSVTQGPGYASALRDQMIVEAENAPRYRSAPPQGRPYQPPQSRQPYVKTVRTVINEPRGYAPPGQSQSQGYQVQSQQASSQQPSNVLYYDPKTGALSSSGHQYSAPTGPVACGTQSCAPQVAYQTQAAPQTFAYQQPAPQVAYQVQPQVAYQTQPQVAYQAQPQMMAQPQMFGYQQAAQPVTFAYPQQQQMSQPIVVPGQLYTANGGVQQLG
jgi:hypothetical protein